MIQAVSAFQDRINVGNIGVVTKHDLIARPGLQRELREDPRGIVWLWEPPQKRAQYVIGIDPTDGITGWTRYNRTDNDKRTNNGAIEITKFEGNKATQVAEYAGPVDPFELGYIANILGRIYTGSNEDDQAKVILETYPGPGAMTLRKMVELGYGNFWTWEYYAEKIPEQTSKVGWTASNQSIRDLWSKSSREICMDNVNIKSPWLVEEYADQRTDPIKGYAVSPNNTKGHGDRVRAMNLSLWAGFGWSMEVERTSVVITNDEQHTVDYAASDMSLEEIQNAWEDRMERMYNSQGW